MCLAAARGGYFIVSASCGAPVVVVQTSEHGNSLDAAFAAGHPWNRLLLGERLVLPRLVVEAHVLGPEKSRMRFALEQQVVEKLLVYVDDATGSLMQLRFAESGSRPTESPDGGRRQFDRRGLRFWHGPPHCRER